MMYNFYKTNIDNKKSLKESLPDASRFVKKLLKELTIFVIMSDLLIAIKEKYKDDNVVQRIMIIKIVNQLKISHNLIKKKKKLKLSDYKIHNQMLYINSRLYVSNHSKLKTKIIKYIHEFPSNEYVKRSLIYDKINLYYY